MPLHDKPEGFLKPQNDKEEGEFYIKIPVNSLVFPGPGGERAPLFWLHSPPWATLSFQRSHKHPWPEDNPGRKHDPLYNNAASPCKSQGPHGKSRGPTQPKETKDALRGCTADIPCHAKEHEMFEF